MNNISILGGGAWGRALAYAFSQKNSVHIYSRRKLEFLKSFHLRTVRQVELEEALKSPIILVVVKSSVLKDFLTLIGNRVKDSSILILASKGIDPHTGEFLSDIFSSHFPNNRLGYLTGPSFAAEVLDGLPCALNIHTIHELGDLTDIFPSFIRLYFNDDVIGGEVCGAYKNVIAIASGICDGLKLGNNAKASLIARGLVEMARFGEFFGASKDTFLGLSGAGDLFLSANSVLSRNYRVGFNLTKDKSLSNILNNLGEVAEGVYSCYAINLIADKHNLYIPIAKQVRDVLEGKDPKDGAEELLGKSF